LTGLTPANTKVRPVVPARSDEENIPEGFALIVRVKSFSSNIIFIPFAITAQAYP